ncbi:hypothetical protein DFH08DRAFT_845543 [Mycena albidolilacea]|uniref:Uncharacterized protein n=1 Tax=Mycena albidolilacea TaxID=1033008 RepID=A0AAD7AIE4_9AGAR|nr:hypothetical protein DFH08DRAFT_845543 [Mycena albidolilacea]
MSCEVPRRRPWVLSQVAARKAFLYTFHYRPPSGSSMPEDLRKTIWVRTSAHPAIVALVTLLVFAVLRRIFRLVKVARTTSYFPKRYTPFHPFVLPGSLFTTSSWIDGRNWHWVRRFQTYSHNETVNLVPILTGSATLWTSNIDIGRQIVAESPRSSFIKSSWSLLTLL